MNTAYHPPGMARNEKNGRIKVVIADDHRAFGEAMQIALGKEDDLSVIEVVEDGDLAITVTLEEQPDVVLMDLRMPGTDGIEATRRIRAEGGKSAIVILTGEADDRSLARAIQAGAKGLMNKTAAVDDLAKAVRMAARGEPLHLPAEVNRVLEIERARSERDRELQRRVGRLTPREIQILQAMADGLDARADRREARHVAPHAADAHPEHPHEARRPFEDGRRDRRDPVRQGHPSRPCAVGS